MALVAGNVINEVKALLNDPTGSIYPDVSLFPLLRKSYQELQSKLASNGYSATRDISTPVVLPMGTLFLGDGAGLPTDFLLPIEVKERGVGATDWVPMEEKIWESTEKQQPSLRWWAWREEALWFVGATTPREILIKYRKLLTPIVDGTSPILINNSGIFLAQRTAALAALLLGSNASRSDALMNDLYAQNGPWEDLKAMLMHKMQSIPVRRRRTRWRR